MGLFEVLKASGIVSLLIDKLVITSPLLSIWEFESIRGWLVKGVGN